MEIEVVCAGCMRTERWRDGRDARQVEIVQEGGQRRVDGSPVLARARTALASARGEVGAVVGVCSACGQLLVQRAGPAARPIAVRLDTADGAVVVEGPVIAGPVGAMSADDAETFLVARLGARWHAGLAGQVVGASMVMGLFVPIAVGFVLTGLFLLSFFSSLWQGAPPAVSGSPGYYEPP